MSLVDLASSNSFWYGYDYFKSARVLSCNKTGPAQYEGTVQGSLPEPYKVAIDLEHPKKSMCNCPHAEGNRRVCKHKVALYFTVFPKEADDAYKAAEAWAAEEEKRKYEEYKRIEEYVNTLSEEELREQLIWRMIDENDNPRW